MKKQTIELDRLSSLPDEIILYMFSFLDMRVFVQLSILSSRWRNLWMSTPFVKFQLGLCKTRMKIIRTSFINFVDRVLFLRNEASNILTLRLCCHEKLEADRIYTVVMAALKRNLQELDLEVASTRLIKLPYSLFKSRNLNVLRLAGFGGSRIILLNRICLNNSIRCLELRSVKLPLANSNGELIFRFAVIENLVIHSCFIDDPLKSFTISAPLLERLELTYMFEEWLSLDPIKVNICTPKLKLFIYTGRIYGDYSLENLSALVSAEISILKPMFWVEKEVYARYIAHMLTGIYNVKKLLIPTWVVKTITDSPCMLERLPIIFPNLRYMKLVDGRISDKPCIEEMATFVERLFHIEHFIWSRGSYSQEMVLGSANKARNCRNSSLKTIEIHNALGSDGELKLLEVLLEKSKDLEKIIIKESESLSKDKFKLSKFCEKMSNFLAFSSVQISFS